MQHSFGLLNVKAERLKIQKVLIALELADDDAFLATVPENVISANCRSHQGEAQRRIAGVSNPMMRTRARARSLVFQRRDIRLDE